MTSWNKYEYNKWVKLGCSKNGDIAILNCDSNKLTSLSGIENLTNLTVLECSNNQLDSLVGIRNLTNLTKLSQKV